MAIPAEILTPFDVLILTDFVEKYAPDPDDTPLLAAIPPLVNTKGEGLPTWPVREYSRKTADALLKGEIPNPTDAMTRTMKVASDWIRRMRRIVWTPGQLREIKRLTKQAGEAEYERAAEIITAELTDKRGDIDRANEVMLWQILATGIINGALGATIDLSINHTATVAASWAVAGTAIHDELRSKRVAIEKAAKLRPSMARPWRLLVNQKIEGYFKNNTYLQDFWKRGPFNHSIIESGVEGLVIEKLRVTVVDNWYENAAGVLTDYVADDVAIICPDFGDRRFWGMMPGPIDDDDAGDQKGMFIKTFTTTDEPKNHTETSINSSEFPIVFRRTRFTSSTMLLPPNPG